MTALPQSPTRLIADIRAAEDVPTFGGYPDIPLAGWQDAVSSTGDNQSNYRRRYFEHSMPGAYPFARYLAIKFEGIEFDVGYKDTNASGYKDAHLELAPWYVDHINGEGGIVFRVAAHPSSRCQWATGHLPSNASEDLVIAHKVSGFVTCKAANGSTSLDFGDQTVVWPSGTITAQRALADDWTIAANPTVANVTYHVSISVEIDLETLELSIVGTAYGLTPGGGDGGSASFFEGTLDLSAYARTAKEWRYFSAFALPESAGWLEVQNDLTAGSFDFNLFGSGGGSAFIRAHDGALNEDARKIVHGRVQNSWAAQRTISFEDVGYGCRSSAITVDDYTFQGYTSGGTTDLDAEGEINLFDDVFPPLDDFCDWPAAEDNEDVVYGRFSIDLYGFSWVRISFSPRGGGGGNTISTATSYCWVNVGDLSGAWSADFAQSFTRYNNAPTNRCDVVATINSTAVAVTALSVDNFSVTVDEYSELAPTASCIVSVDILTRQPDALGPYLLRIYQRLRPYEAASFTSGMDEDFVAAEDSAGTLSLAVDLLEGYVYLFDLVAPEGDIIELGSYRVPPRP